MKKNNKTVKKVFTYIGLAIDIGLTIFFLVVAIIMLATMPKDNAEIGKILNKEDKNFIEWFQVGDPDDLGQPTKLHSTVYLLTNVVPLLALLVLNIVIVYRYIKKLGETRLALKDLSKDQKEALKEALLRDMNANKESSKEIEDKKKEEENKDIIEVDAKDIEAKSPAVIALGEAEVGEKPVKKPQAKKPASKKTAAKKPASASKKVTAKKSVNKTSGVAKKKTTASQSKAKPKANVSSKK